MFPLMKLRKKLHDGSASSKPSKHKITAECIIKEKNPQFGVVKVFQVGSIK